MTHHPFGPGPGWTAPADRGASLAEYALLVALIALVAVGGLRVLGSNTDDAFDAAADATSGSVAAMPGSGGEGAGSGGEGGGSGSGGTGGGTGDGGTGGSASTTVPEPVDDEADDPGDPVEVGGLTSIDGSAVWVDSSNWKAEASVVVRGADGNPLNLSQTQIHYNRIRLVTYSVGGPVFEVSDGNQVTSVDPHTGLAVLSGITVPYGEWYAVVGVRFEVTKVIHNGSGTDPSDGHTPSITVIPAPK